MLLSVHTIVFSPGKHRSEFRLYVFVKSQDSELGLGLASAVSWNSLLVFIVVLDSFWKDLMWMFEKQTCSFGGWCPSQGSPALTTLPGLTFWDIILTLCLQVLQFLLLVIPSARSHDFKHIPWKPDPSFSYMKTDKDNVTYNNEQ